MGYLPGTMWIVFGVIFAGAVQDMVILFFSMRRDGKSLGQMARDEIGLGRAAALVAVFAIMIILLAVLALVVVNALADSPWGTFSLAMTIPIALFMGFTCGCCGRDGCWRPPPSGSGCCWRRSSSAASSTTPAWPRRSPSPKTLVVCLVVYGFAGSVLPVWMLLAPRDYLSTFMKVWAPSACSPSASCHRAGAGERGRDKFASSGKGPVFAGPLFPFVFIIIACGALSGFHALIASGTTPKLIEKESQVRMIGYGAMLTESFVAVMAMIAASILDQGLYFAMNSPPGVVGTTVQSASEAVTNLGFTITPTSSRRRSSRSRSRP